MERVKSDCKSKQVISSKHRKGRTKVSDFERFLLREASKVLLYPAWLLRIYLKTVNGRFGFYRDIFRDSDLLKGYFADTIFDTAMTDTANREWNGKDTEDRTAKKRYQVANHYISERSCYRILQTKTRNQVPGKTTRKPGTVVVHAINIISEAEQFSDIDDANRPHRFLLVLAERYTGFLLLKLFKDFKEENLLEGIKRFKRKLDTLSMPVQEIRFVSLDGAKRKLTTACHKSESEIKTLLNENGIIDPKNIIVESPHGYQEQVVIQFPNSDQMDIFLRLKAAYDNALKSQDKSETKPIGYPIDTVFSLTRPFKNIKKIENVRWARLQLRSFDIKAPLPKHCLRLCDIVETGNMPLIIPRDHQLSRQWLVKMLNQYNIGTEGICPPPLALMWQHYTSIDHEMDNIEEDSMEYYKFRKLMELR